ncbi:hypothetical protein NQ318_013324 [Aromia moschata]|uniref:Uncharacterized protein n=1 Tax=Aromia moschata TaxID=1265417 RepID=A0AAV8XZ50_9CUCU|nr:hypothetical protein NQ318_013324 [Aromia moschata]
MNKLSYKSYYYTYNSFTDTILSSDNEFIFTARITNLTLATRRGICSLERNRDLPYRNGNSPDFISFRKY